jgi:hypothetical protein
MYILSVRSVLIKQWCGVSCTVSLVSRAGPWGGPHSPGALSVSRGTGLCRAWSLSPHLGSFGPVHARCARPSSWSLSLMLGSCGTWKIVKYNHQFYTMLNLKLVIPNEVKITLYTSFHFPPMPNISSPDNCFQVLLISIHNIFCASHKMWCFDQIPVTTYQF